MHPRLPRSKTIVIVGGRGRMGALFARILRQRGHTVRIIEKGEALSAAHFEKAHLVLLAVGMQHVLPVSKRVLALVPQNCLLCDMNSLKQEVCALFKSKGRCESMGMHPMFGPTVKSFHKQKFIFCAVKRGPISHWWEEELMKLGAAIRFCSPAEHDQMMACVQALIHFNKFVVAKTLKLSGISLKKTLEFTSPIYRLEFAILGRMFAQDAGLYAHIQSDNPYARKITRLFAQIANGYAHFPKGKSKQNLITDFKAAQKYFKKFASESLRLSDKILESLVEHS